jgi:hypothetical protein
MKVKPNPLLAKDAGFGLVDVYDSSGIVIAYDLTPNQAMYIAEQRNRCIVTETGEWPEPWNREAIQGRNYEARR